MNDAGIIVGISCSAAVAWKPLGGGVYTRVLLGDLGQHCNGTCVAKAINNAAIPIAVGGIGQNSTGTSGQAVFWLAF